MLIAFALVVGYAGLAAFVALRVIVAAAAFGALYLLLVITHTLFSTISEQSPKGQTLAASLGISRVYVPLFPGLFSALGLLLADLRYDYVQSVPGRLDAVDPASLLREFDALAARVQEEVFREEISPARVQLERFIDLRYARQSSELTLKVPESVAAAELSRVLAEAFHAEHERTYKGFRRNDE